MKMLKNMMFVAAMFAVAVVHAKQVGGTKAQSKGTSQQQEIERFKREQEVPKKEQTGEKQLQEESREEQTQKTAPSQKSQVVSPEEWKKIENELNSDKIPSTMRMKQIRNMQLTSEQRNTLRLIEQIILLRKQVVAQANAKTRKAQNKQAASSKSWFSGWLGTEADQTDNYKNMILNVLANEELYPTLKSKQEALELGVEFSEPGYNDVNVMNKARADLKQDFSQGSIAPITPIDQLVNNLRNYFEFNLSDVLSDEFLSNQEKVKEVGRYLNDINSKIKDFVVKYITNTNAQALLRAINSESQRMQNIIDILSGKTVQKEITQKQSAQKKVESPQEEVANETEEIVSPWGLGFRKMFRGSEPTVTTTAPSGQEPIVARPITSPTGSSVQKKPGVGLQGGPVGQ